MPLGIRPINDFAFMITFGTEENKVALISLLNAILAPKSPIVDVTLKNPFNRREFDADKLSILDIKAIDDSGAIHDVEMQLTTFEGLVQRIVYYGCRLYSGQLLKGDDWREIKPVYAICLLDGILWQNATQVHHAFRLTDQKPGQVLEGTLEVHTLELGRYNLGESDLKKASMLDCWLFWLLHAHEYEPEELLKLFPHEALQKATKAITRIAQITEDKAMYDAREMAIRDRQTAMNCAREEGEAKGKIEGKIEGEIKMIRALQRLLYMPLSTDEEFQGLNLEQLEAITNGLQVRLRNR
jgi:predicted transposase/invertase (TIGR01784 family)